ncbi:MAG: trimethylamine methyltransferase family protein, partial [Pseudomonadota bacterium]
MSVAEDTNRRRGGREARKAMRSRAIPVDEAAVRPGMQGGKYKPLTQAEIEKIHQAALTLLETVGIGNSIPSCIEMMTEKGCTLDENGRLRFPRALIEDTLTICARRFPLFARDPKYDLEPWGTNVHFGTAGAAVHVVDPETETYRDSLLIDLYDAARIVDNCEHIHFFQRPLVARDMVEPRDLDVNTL